MWSVGSIAVVGKNFIVCGDIQTTHGCIITDESCPCMTQMKEKSVTPKLHKDHFV